MPRGTPKAEDTPRAVLTVPSGLSLKERRKWFYKNTGHVPDNWRVLEVVMGNAPEKEVVDEVQQHRPPAITKIRQGQDFFEPVKQTRKHEVFVVMPKRLYSALQFYLPHVIRRVV